MTDTAPPALLFGIPLLLERAEGQQLADDLFDLWVRQMGHPPAALDKDLDALRTYFDPLARGPRLRRLLAELPPLPTVRSGMLRSPVVLGDDGQLLVTLEGRSVLAVLDDLLKRNDSDPLQVNPRIIYAAEHRVYERYRQWSIRRIEDVLRLQVGEGQALSLPSLAFLLLLLINRSRSPDTALRRLDSDADQRTLDTEQRQRLREAQRRLDAAIGCAVDAFWNRLSTRTREARPFAFYSGYAVTEPRRRLPGELSPNPEMVYIIPGGEDRVLAQIVAELRRPHRSPSTTDVLRAFDELVKAYRDELPTFAAFGMAHEQRLETRRLRQRLKEALDGDRASS